jgi:hypothetical protein
MKWIKPVVLSLMFGLATFVAAQQVDTSEVPDKTEVLKFLDLMRARSQMVQSLHAMSTQMRLGAEQGFKQKVPNATPEQLAKVDKLFEGIFADLPIDEMIDGIVPIYQKHLTRRELAAITEFYSSPAGQKILNEMPAILAESMQVGGEIGRRAFSAKSAEFDKRLADLVDASPKPAQSDAPK